MEGISTEIPCANLYSKTLYYWLSGYLKIDKTKVLMEKCSLMKVESIRRLLFFFFFFFLGGGGGG